MVQRHIWRVYMFGLLQYTSEHGRAHQFCEVRADQSSYLPFGTYAFIFFSHRSTNLDSWQLSQLRTMKVGGNASAKEFFTKHGGSALLQDSDTKKKYSSRVADLYKEELSKRVSEDAVRYPIYL